MLNSQINQFHLVDIEILADVGSFSYGLGHPMKPHRIRMTHDLVSAYDMLDRMKVLVCYCSLYDSLIMNRNSQLSPQRPRRSTPEDMTAFHTDEYIDFLNKVTPETCDELTIGGQRCRSIRLPIFIHPV